MATKVIALSVIVEDYSEVRRLQDFKGFKDLETLRYDQSKFREGCKVLGVEDENFKTLKNPDYDVFLKTLNELQK